MQISPINGPFEFSPRGEAKGPEMEASVFIAQRLAGIEWQLVQLNKNLFDLINKGIAPRQS